MCGYTRFTGFGLAACWLCCVTLASDQGDTPAKKKAVRSATKVPTLHGRPTHGLTDYYDGATPMNPAAIGRDEMGNPTIARRYRATMMDRQVNDQPIQSSTLVVVPNEPSDNIAVAKMHQQVASILNENSLPPNPQRLALFARQGGIQANMGWRGSIDKIHTQAGTTFVDVNVSRYVPGVGSSAYIVERYQIVGPKSIFVGIVNDQTVGTLNTGT